MTRQHTSGWHVIFTCTVDVNKLVSTEFGQVVSHWHTTIGRPSPSITQNSPMSAAVCAYYAAILSHN